MGILTLVLLLLCCVGAAALLYNLGLWSFRLPDRPFTADALLLSTEDLGSGWVLSAEEHNPNGYPDKNIIVEIASRNFVYRTKEGDLIEVGGFVYRCDNKIHARSYLREDRLYFGDNLPPDNLVDLFQPHYADDRLLYMLGDFLHYSAVYDEYYVNFGIGPISAINGSEESTVIYGRLGQGLYTLDERIGRLLGKVP